MKGSYLPVTFNKIMQANHYTVFILSCEGKLFPVFSSPSVGVEVQALLAEQPPQRPKTHDLLESIFKGLEVQPLELVFEDVEDDIYYCKLLIEQSQGVQQTIVEVDSRPSDGLLIALKNNLPIYVKKSLLDKVPEFHG